VVKTVIAVLLVPRIIAAMINVTSLMMPSVTIELTSAVTLARLKAQTSSADQVMTFALKFPSVLGEQECVQSPSCNLMEPDVF
jgi:ABC-type transporter Mla maintaining outer membrane lipid asymmetry permease subunit MlaE